MAEEGIEIHDRAHNLFPNGILIEESNFKRAVEQTAQLIKDKSTSVIFEASFSIDSYNTKADILQRTEKGWHLYEVKSSVNQHDEYIDDMAYTCMVVKKAGLSIDKCYLILISPDYRLGMSDDELFLEYDYSDEVFSRAKEYNKLWDTINSIHKLKNVPTPELIFACKDCELFSNCVGAGAKNPIFDLPRLSNTKFSQLRDRGIFCIEDIPNDFELTDKQEVVKQSIDSGQTIIKKELQQEFGQIDHPAYYLDFETVQTAIPLYPDISPFTKIVTQYSIHRCSSIGYIEHHYEYLADPSRDCRRDLAEQLIQDCGQVGSILVYSNFEQTVVNSLIQEFPDLEKELGKLVNRMVDLCAILQRNYYHPEFHGSYSIKVVLPVLVPDMTYEDMEVGGGSAAIAVFAYLAQGKYSSRESREKREQLLEYCKMDTLAMVRLVGELVDIG